MNERKIAFISGSFWGMLAGLGGEVLTALVLGIVGGVGGLIGKEIFNYLKVKFKRNEKE